MRVRKHYSAFPPRSFLALQLSGLFFFVLLGDLPQELFHKLFRLSGGKAWIRGHHLSDNEHSPIEVNCLSIRNSNHGMNFKPLIIALPVAFLIGCASEPTPDMLPGGQPNFDTYAIQAKAYVAERRHYVTDDHVAEIEGNSPFEIRPKNPNGQAVLMIHGLGDSPWTFTDLGKTLADQGYLVRTMLLPGHGTRPADMIGVTSEDWTKAVNEQVALLKKQYPKIWLAGFSTGCNLALDYSEEHPDDVEGLLLFSPAMQVRTSLIKLAPIADLFVTWLRAPDKKTAGDAPFKYNTVPMDAIVAFKHTMDTSNDYLTKNKITKPVIVMMSQHDSIINTQSLVKVFDKALTNPASKIIWYGKLPDGKYSKKVVAKSDYLPELRIKSFAHMSIPFSPDNVWYGKDGKFRYCRNSASAKDVQDCRNDPDVWYGAWGTHDGEHSFARLTYNPYFGWQAKQILKVMKSGEQKPRASGIIEKVEPQQKGLN